MTEGWNSVPPPPKTPPPAGTYLGLTPLMPFRGRHSSTHASLKVIFFPSLLLLFYYPCISNPSIYLMIHVPAIHQYINVSIQHLSIIINSSISDSSICLSSHVPIIYLSIIHQSVLSIHLSCISLSDIHQSICLSTLELCDTVSPVSPVDRLTELLLNSSGHKSTVTNGNQELSSK